MKKMTRQEAKELLEVLFETYPGLKPYLNAKTPFECLIATILSAQTTDKRVNEVSPSLFARFPRPKDLARADEKDLEDLIRPLGFYRNKAKNILGAARGLVERFGGEVPSSMEELLTLPGVGRKTANVVRANAFSIPTMPVDTHVFRVSNRIGLSQSKNPDQCEKDLCQILPEENWNYAHLAIIQHGRTLCKARKPLCGNCPIQAYCRYFAGGGEGRS